VQVEDRVGVARVTCSLLAGLVAAGAAAVSAGGSASAKRATACRAPARTEARVLPVWARGGFSDPKPRMPYRLGREGRIAAILWADPLRSPAPVDHNNKILWVSHAATIAGSDLRISAQLMVGATPAGKPVARRVMGGPGPSIINLPSAGCWRLTLRWSHTSDVLDLRYAPRS
jgi:hypothetical protein